MYNDLFHIGKLTIHGYGTMIAVGVLVAVAVAIFRCKKKQIDPEPILDLVLIALIGGFLGGWLMSLAHIQTGSGIIWELLVSVIGAVALLFIISLFKKK